MKYLSPIMAGIFLPFFLYAQCDASFTVSDLTPCGEDEVIFTIDNPDSGFTYTWDFGDGMSTAEGDTASFVFPIPADGNEAYQVSVTATDTSGVSCSGIQIVNVLATPEITITDLNFDPVNGSPPFVFCDANANNPNFPVDIQLTSPNGAVIQSFTLDWGDGSPVETYDGSDLPLDLAHTYTELGRFELVIILEGQGSCDNTESVFVFNGTNPAVGLETPGGTVGLCAPQTLSFPITGTANNTPGTTYEVFINDSLVAMYNHPPPNTFTYTFTETTCGQTGPSGEQNAIAVRIVANTPCGFSNATIAPVTVGTPPMADIGASPPAGACEGEVVTFTNETIGSAFIVNQDCNDAVNLRWRILPETGWALVSGDTVGTSLGAANEIEVTFSQVGIYQVELTADNGCGEDVYVLEYEILDPPLALAEPTGSGCAPSTFTFNNLSENNLTDAWSVTPAAGWSFTNGSDENTENPSLLFTEPGTYTVTLDVTNSCGLDSWDTTLVIQGLPIVSLDPIADFCETATLTPTATVDANGCPGQNCVWTFSNGMPGTVNGCDPGMVSFTVPGNQEVILTVTNCCGTTSDTVSFFIEEPITDIEAGDTLNLCVGDTCVNLSALGAPTGGTWTNAAGATLMEFCPSAPGTFQLDYTVGTGLCQAMDSLIIVVNPLPALTLLTSQALFCENDSSFSFSADPPGGVWSGPGINAAGLFVPAQAGVGDHTLTYSFQDAVTGCSNDLTVPVTVAGLAGLALTDETFCLTVEDLDLEDYYGLNENNGVGTWMGPGIINSDDGIFNPVVAAGGTTNPTTVTVTYTFTTNEGCVSVDSASLELIPLTIIDAGPDTTICISGSTYTLEANLPDVTWYGPSISPMGVINLMAVGEGAWPYEVVAFEGESCESRDTVVVTILDLGNLDAGPDLYVCETEGDVLLTGAVIPGNVSLAWSGAGITNPNVPLVDVQQLAAGTTYPVVLSIESNDVPGCIATDSLLFTVAALPQVSFTVDGEICQDSIVSFSIDTVGVDAVQWTFGPFGTSAELNPTVTFDLPGTFTVSVTAVSLNPLAPGQELCSVTSSLPVTVGQEPELVAFTTDTDEGCADLSVSLTNNSIGDNLNFEWYLGDTLFSTAVTPDPLLLGQGRTDTTYLVSLQVANGCGGNLAEQEILVRPRPVPAFGTDFNEYCSGDSVLISNVSYGNVVNYLWLFGEDGAFGSSNDSVPPPVSFFAAQETIFPITLIVSNDCGIDTLVQEVTVRPTDVQSFFNSDPTEVCVGDTVCFTNFSTVSAEVTYDFGDSNASTNPNPCHVYQAPGIYTVVQRAYACGFDSTSAVITVAPAPEVAFLSDPVACRDAPVTFTNASNGVVAYDWNFGDGEGSGLASPVHAFDTAGVFTVVLTGTSANGCTAEAAGTVDIQPLPVADFFFTDSLCAGSVAQFTNTSTGQIDACAWTFGNGNSSSFCDPQQGYPDPGQYPVDLIVISGEGCRDTVSRLLYVREVPVPDFTVTLDGTCSPVVATFSNQSENATSFLWEFGNGDTSDATNPVDTFYTGGTYTVRLTATNEGICAEEQEQLLTVYQTPIAAFDLATPEACAPATFTYNNTSTGDIEAYQWSFSDGNTLFEANPQYTISEPGAYTVTLVVETQQCADTTSLDLTVHPAITAAFTVADLLCFGDTNGAIDLNPVGGTPPFAYAWSNGAQEQDLEDLAAGDYGLTITDVNGCEWRDTVGVSEPPALSVGILDQTIVTCFEGDDGAVSVAAEGGVGGYSYLWSTGTTGAGLTDLSAGSYGLTVTDANGCELLETVVVNENSQLGLIDMVTPISCAGFNDGVIGLDSIFGGVGPYTIEMAGPGGLLPAGDRFAGLSAGSYELTILDANGCMLQRDYSFLEPAAIFIDILPESGDLIMGDSLVLATNYNAQEPVFSWAPPDDLDCFDCDAPLSRPLRTVTYTVSMTDRNGCTVLDSITLDVRPLRAVYFPNAFSPDGDGNNDVFMVRSGDPGLRLVREFRVFDRWGAQMFSAEDFRPNDPDFGWDGRGRNDVDLQPGVFAWFAVIEFIDGEVKEYAGEVLLIR